jgi:hypothetical protein
VKKKRAITIIGGVLGALLVLLMVAAAMSTSRVAVNVVDYATAKKGSQHIIVIAITNNSRFSIQRMDRIEIEQVSPTWCSRLRRADSAVLPSGSGEHIEVQRPEARGRWRVVVFTCPSWRVGLDNDFTRKLHLRFLYATYHGAYGDWIDD